MAILCKIIFFLQNDDDDDDDEEEEEEEEEEKKKLNENGRDTAGRYGYFAWGLRQR